MTPLPWRTISAYDAYVERLRGNPTPIFDKVGSQFLEVTDLSHDEPNLVAYNTQAGTPNFQRHFVEPNYALVLPTDPSNFPPRKD